MSLDEKMRAAWADRGEDSSPIRKRDPIVFVANSPERVTFEYSGGKEFPSLYDERKIRTMYSLLGNKVLYADEELAVKINFCEPQKGDSLWIEKRQSWVGSGKKRHRTTEWVVSADGKPPVNRQPNTPPTDMGIDESDLERELRESRELKQRAQTRSQARENVARMPEPAPSPALAAAAEGCLALDAPPIERRPAAMASTAAAPDSRPGWYVALVSQTKDLVDALAEVRLHAEKHGQRVSFDDCERLLVTSLIGKQRQRA